MGELEGARTDLLNNPLFLRGQALAQQYLNDPYTFSDSVKQMMKASAIGQAQGSYQGGLKDLWEKAGSSGGYRSGFSRGQEMRLAQGLGEQTSNIDRGIETQAAMQRPVDIQNAMSVEQNALMQRYYFDTAIANFLQGAATNPILASPTATEGVTQGLTSLISGGKQSGGGYSGGGGGQQSQKASAPSYSSGANSSALWGSGAPAGGTGTNLGSYAL